MDRICTLFRTGAQARSQSGVWNERRHRLSARAEMNNTMKDFGQKMSVDWHDWRIIHKVSRSIPKVDCVLHVEVWRLPRALYVYFIIYFFIMATFTHGRDKLTNWTFIAPVLGVEEDLMMITSGQGSAYGFVLVRRFFFFKRSSAACWRQTLATVLDYLPPKRLPGKGLSQFGCNHFKSVRWTRIGE